MRDLVDFLLARISEDERVAQDCIDEFPPDEPYGLEYDHDHQARWIPERTLVECLAKRMVVSLFAPKVIDDLRAARGEWDQMAFRGEQALRAIARPYANHPDYKPSWRPI